jgi:CRISPR-associated protein Cas2
MFVLVNYDFSTDDHKKAVCHLLKQYGFEEILNDSYESRSIGENSLSKLKLDIDRITDSYDIIRFYQYPVENTLVITTLKEKKWRRSKIII